MGTAELGLEFFLLQLGLELVCLREGRKNFPSENRRKTGKNLVSASHREMKFPYFSSFSVFKFKNSKIFIKNPEKYDKNYVFF